MLAPDYSWWQNVPPRIIAFILAGSVLVWWAYIWKRKRSWGNGRWSCPWGEQISSATWAPPTACIRPLRFWAHPFHGHLNDRFETVQHRDSNFTLCTKCKVMQLPSNEKQRRKPKVPIREWRTLGIGKWAALLRVCGGHRAAPPWLVYGVNLLRPFHCFQAPELPWVVFGDYRPVILTFSCYNLAKSFKHSLGDVCTSDEKVTRKINNFGIEVRGDKIRSGGPNNCSDMLLILKQALCEILELMLRK